MIISFINQKGGCAKSTTAVHFAYWLATKKKKKIGFVDTDEQQSSLVWLKAMGDDKILAFHLTDTNAIIEQIPDLADHSQFVIVDGPASAQETTRAILFISDLAIIPVQPAAIDLHSTAETIRLITQAQKIRGGLPSAAAFLSRAINRTRLKHEAIAFLDQVPELQLLKSVIHQRVV